MNSAAKGAIHVLRGDRLRARLVEELDAIALHYTSEPLLEPVLGAGGAGGDDA